MEDYIIGVILSIIAAAAASLGDNTIKLAYTRRAREEEDRELASDDYDIVDNGVEQSVCVPAEPRPIYLDPLFLFGNFCLTIINTVLNLASMAFADASVTIPFGGLHIVLNVPLAYIINRERSSLRALFLNGLIFISVVIILVSGNRESTEVTARELAGNFFQLSFFVVTMCIVALGLFVRMSMLSPLEKTQRLGMTMGAGLIGALTQLFAKAMSLCLKDGAWGSPITYFFILTTIISALCQVYSLNRCLDLFSASFTVPIVNAVIIVVGSLYSAVFFREVERWDTESRIFVPFGIFLCAASIAALSNEPEPTEVREPAMSELSSAAFEEALIDPEATQVSIENAQPLLLQS